MSPKLFVNSVQYLYMQLAHKSSSYRDHPCSGDLAYNFLTSTVVCFYRSSVPQDLLWFSHKYCCLLLQIIRAAGPFMVFSQVLLFAFTDHLCRRTSYGFLTSIVVCFYRSSVPQDLLRFSHKYCCLLLQIILATRPLCFSHKYCCLLLQIIHAFSHNYCCLF